jgi:co-chaperonin GroES (HSP10)
MRAINKYIIIQEIVEEMKTASGILLTGEDTKDFRYKKGKVINPGTNVESIKEGDVIYYDKSSGHKMIIDENQYSIIMERDVVVVL